MSRAPGSWCFLTMSKSIKRGLDDVFFKKEIKTLQNAPSQSVRFTLILEKDLLKKIKGLAYWEEKTIKDVITKALQQYIDVYEHKNGDIKVK